MIKSCIVTNLLARSCQILFFYIFFLHVQHFISPTGNDFTSKYWYFWKSIKSKCKNVRSLRILFLSLLISGFISKQRKLHEKEVKQFFSEPKILLSLLGLFWKGFIQVLKVWNIWWTCRCYRKDYEPLIIWIILAVFLIVNFELKMLRT